MQAARGAVASAGDTGALEHVRIRYLGRKGEITQLLKQLGSLPPAERPAAGQAVNAARDELNALLEARRAALESAQVEARLVAERIDVTLPGRGQQPGAL